MYWTELYFKTKLYSTLFAFGMLGLGMMVYLVWEWQVDRRRAKLRREREEEVRAEKAAREAEYLHNFGNLDPIPEGAVALCGAISTRTGAGEIAPERSKCCPACLCLTVIKEGKYAKP